MCVTSVPKAVPKAVPEAVPKAAPKAAPEAVPVAAPEAAPAAGARRLAHGGWCTAAPGAAQQSTSERRVDLNSAEEFQALKRKVVSTSKESGDGSVTREIL